ncbi:MAG: hypothetical protein ACI4D7_03810, partial [Lachnospiraceae bacterium]
FFKEISSELDKSAHQAADLSNSPVGGYRTSVFLEKREENQLPLAKIRFPGASLRSFFKEISSELDKSAHQAAEISNPPVEDY